MDDAFARLRAYWDNLLGNFNVRTPEGKLDRMVNIWNQYQCMITFCFSRSASYFESGIGRGIGFRDSNQALIGFVKFPNGPVSVLSTSLLRKFRGATYHITVNNPNGKMKGVSSVTVDGKQIEGNVVPVQPAGSVCEVEVIL